MALITRKANKIMEKTAFSPKNTKSLAISLSQIKNRMVDTIAMKSEVNMQVILLLQKVRKNAT